MKGLLLMLHILGICLSANSQHTYNISNSNYHYFIPDCQATTTGSIANYINSHYNTEEDKLLAAYIWVTKNIQYNKDSMYSINWNEDKQAKITEAMRRRKGVCENYAAIFTDIATKAGIECYVVYGYTKQNAETDRTDHAWCVLQMNNQWYCCDPTWDKDSNENFQYFMLSPSQFIANHMPFDPIWQLLHHPLSNEEFKKGYLSSRNKNYLAFEDSIKAYNHLSELGQLQQTYNRMKALGYESKLMQNRLAYIHMEIALIYENNDMQLYNEAVSCFNNAIKLYNFLSNNRNNIQSPANNNDEVLKQYENISNSISGAYNKLNALSSYNQQYDPSELYERLKELKNKVKQQTELIPHTALTQKKDD
ncbi:MAG: hypothetical protein JSU03_09955 [Bacteroidetes bacterium]|nr:hypothetical protein [Bacteroidota bacterium]